MILAIVELYLLLAYSVAAPNSRHPVLADFLDSRSTAVAGTQCYFAAAMPPLESFFRNLLMHLMTEYCLIATSQRRTTMWAALSSQFATYILDKLTRQTITVLRVR